MFNALFDAIVVLAKQKGVQFEHHPSTRLHSILKIENLIHYTIATREHPNKKSAARTTDAAWLAMPRAALELVAQATRYEDHRGLDGLNHQKVQLYLESAILQPTSYPPQRTSYEVKANVVKALAKQDFPGIT